MIWAILRAQLLSLRMRKGVRAGIGVSVFTGLIFYGLFASFGWALMLFFSAADDTGRFLSVLSGLLLIIAAYWQLAPVISASFGAAIDLRKLMAYPIPTSKLFLIEVLLRLTTCVEMLLVVTGICAGLMRNQAYGMKVAPFILCGALAFTVMNILVSAGIRHWVERFFLKKRFKEIFFVILALSGLAPQLFFYFHVKHPLALLRFAPSQILWPWATPAHLMLQDRILISILVAGGWICASLLFSRRQFELALRFDGASVKKVREPERAGISEKIFRLPSRFLPDPLGALVEKELRTLTRISRFRMAYGMSCIFGFVMIAPQMRILPKGSGFLQFALPLMALYGLLMLGQITYWNSFGFDRSAIQGYFSWPIRFRDALIAKNLTVMVLIIPQFVLVTMVAVGLRLPSSPGKIIEALAVVAIAALYWFPLGNMSSVRMPRAMDPDKMNQMGNKMQALSILAAPLVLIPIVLAYWARSVFQSNIVFAGLLAIAAVLGGIFYFVGLESAVKSATERRESMLIELTRADGPLSIT
jgi:ABC-2 type transport system permease protein